MAIFKDAIQSLTFSKTNKVNGQNDEQKQGVVSDLLPELTLDTDDEQLLKLSEAWTSEWNKFCEKEDVHRRREKMYKYWRGKQMENKMEPDQSITVDNLLFEALETFLPIATKQNPEPVIESAINSEPSLAWNNLLKEILVWIADEVKLRLKLKDGTRHWALNLVGVIKISWDLVENIPVPYEVHPSKIILDANSTIKQGKYSGKFVGELKEDVASDLIARFEEKSEFITAFVEGKLGTKVAYREWWTNEMVFWTLEKTVLGKMRNPHWDYGEETTLQTDDFGEQSEVQIPAMNHFRAPQKPYCFLCVFNTGKQPLDDTTLMEQNIPMQNEINRLNKQISRNVAEMNGTVVVSSDVFNKDQSKSLADAVRDGRPVLVPGSVDEAFKRDQAPSLPADVFNHRNDMRNELRSIYGVTGNTAQGIANEDTATGKLLVREQDASRIGGGISVYIEQWADDIFNWLVQMIYVYFDAQDIAQILGDEKAAQFEELKPMFGNKRIRVSVKEGSLIPHDSLTLRNQAIELAGIGKITDEALYKALDFPDPAKMARELAMQNAGTLYAQPVETAPLNPITAPPASAPPNPLPISI